MVVDGWLNGDTNVGIGMNEKNIVHSIRSNEVRLREIHVSVITAAVEIDGAKLIYAAPIFLARQGQTRC